MSSGDKGSIKVPVCTSNGCAEANVPSNYFTCRRSDQLADDIALEVEGMGILLSVYDRTQILERVEAIRASLIAANPENV